MKANDTNTLMWYIDVALSVHANMKSHMGMELTIGKGLIISRSTTQEVNLRSSTESELVGVEYKISKVLWMKNFMVWQGFPVKLNIIHQDNTSSIDIKDNGKESF